MDPATSPVGDSAWTHRSVAQGFFKQGTTMHLSHLFQDLVAGTNELPSVRGSLRRCSNPASRRAVPGTLASNRQVKVRPKCARVQRYHAYGHTGACRSGQHHIAHDQQLGRPPHGTTIPCAAISTRWTIIPLHIRSDGRPLQQESSGRVHSFSSSRRLQSSISFGSRWTALPRYDTPIAPRSPHAASTRSAHDHRQNYLVRHVAMLFPLAEFLV